MRDDASQAAPDWPPVSYETRPWEMDPDAPMSRTARRLHFGPYQAAVPPLIAEADLTLPANVSALLEEATRSLTRFDADAGPLVAPFSAILLRSESASSSQIENLTSSAKQIGLAELGESRAQNARLIVANVRATQAALALAEDLGEDAIIAMHRTLLEASAPEMVGRWRDVQVWIGSSSVGPHQADFVPPHQERVPYAMADLIRFMRREDLPHLPQIALAHAQFETIHPFPDGNGRTGRALVQAMLKAKGLTQHMLVPVSAGLLSDIETYFSALEAYRTGRALPIIVCFAEAVVKSVGHGRVLLQDMTAIEEAWQRRLHGVRSDAAARRMLPIILAHPVFDASLLGERLNVSAPTLYAGIKTLLERGIITRVTQARRKQVWMAEEVLDALDAFAAAVRRRSGR